MMVAPATPTGPPLPLPERKEDMKDCPCERCGAGCDVDCDGIVAAPPLSREVSSVALFMCGIGCDAEATGAFAVAATSTRG